MMRSAQWYVNRASAKNYADTIRYSDSDRAFKKMFELEVDLCWTPFVMYWPAIGLYALVGRE